MITVSADSLTDLAALYRQAPELFRAELYSATYESGLQVEREVKDKTPKGANHALSQNITAHEPQVFPDGVIGLVGTTLDYAPAVEFGAKPHMPPITPLVDWAMDKLGLDEWEARSAAWGIAMMIKKYGSEGRFMFTHTFDALEPVIKQRFDLALHNITTQMGGV